MHWLELARKLPLGQKTTTECPEQCGSGEKLSIRHDNKSYWCYCYRCGFTESEFKGKQSLEELSRIKKLNEEASELELGLELPKDFTNDIPLQGRLWLYAGGITSSLQRQYNIGYSERLGRVVLPVYDHKGNLIWYQCRAVQQGQKPKYIQPSKDRSSVLFFSTGRRDYSSPITAVEDILSAIKVGRTEQSVSLLGTKLTTTQATMLSKYPRVNVWLDPDRAGTRGAYLIRKTLGLIVPVRNIVSDKDPKELTDNEIKEKLQ